MLYLYHGFLKCMGFVPEAVAVPFKTGYIHVPKGKCGLLGNCGFFSINATMAQVIGTMGF